MLKSRENDGTERDIDGVDWDMSIPLKLFLVLDGNGNAFPETSAQSGAYFQLRIVDVEIPFSIILKLPVIDCSELKFGVLWTGSKSENKQKKLDVRVEERMCNLLIYVVFME